MLDVMGLLTENLQRPRQYWGTKLSMPVSFKIGPNWGDMKDIPHDATPEHIERMIEEALR